LNSFCQTGPAIQWQKCYGGTDLESALSIQQTNDRGYIIAGAASSNDGDVSGHHGGQYDGWVVKTDSIGNLQWQKCLGGSAEDGILRVCLTADGGYVFAGYTSSNDGDVAGNHGSFDFWFVKTDSAGNIQWQKCLGGTNSEWTESFLQTSDGGYIAAGRSFSNDGDVSGNHGAADYWVVKTDSSANIQWQKCFGGTGVDIAYSIQHTSNNGYAIIGRSNSVNGDVTGNHGSYDYWLVKTDSIGNLQWQKSFGGTDEDRAATLLVTSGKEYIFGGYSLSNDSDVSGNHGFEDAWIVKTDSTGNAQWSKCYGGTGSDRVFSIIGTSDKNYLITGHTSSNDGDVSGNHSFMPDYWVFKTDSSGNILWQKCLGGFWEEVCWSIQQTVDSGFVLAGYASSNDGDVSGNHDTTGGGTTDFWIVKLGPDTTTSITQLPQLPNYPITISPNPLTTQSKLTFNNPNKEKFLFTLYDITGRITESVSTTTNEIILTKDGKQPGVYLFNLVNEKTGERWNPDGRSGQVEKIVVSD